MPSKKLGLTISRRTQQKPLTSCEKLWEKAPQLIAEAFVFCAPLPPTFGPKVFDLIELGLDFGGQSGEFGKVLTGWGLAVQGMHFFRGGAGCNALRGKGFEGDFLKMKVCRRQGVRS